MNAAADPRPPAGAALLAWLWAALLRVPAALGSCGSRLGRLALPGMALLAACTTVPPPPPVVATSPLQQSAQRLTDQVLAQAHRQRQVPGSRTPPSAPTVAVLPPPKPKPRPGTTVETQLAQWLAEQLRQQPPTAAVLPVRAEEAARAAWQLQPSLLPADAEPQPDSQAYVLRLELIETATGQVLASASERVVDTQLAELSRALKAGAQAAAAKPSPAPAAPAPAETLQALSAEYVALLKAGHEPEAQRVFARWIETSLQARSLNLKLLFAPSSRSFWPDPALIRRYEFWLAELARQLQASPHCLQVVGHASRSGREEANRRLSLQRATAVKQILLKHAPSLEPRLFTVGLGWEQALPTSAVEDGRAAADQRVDFRILDCP